MALAIVVCVFWGYDVSIGSRFTQEAVVYAVEDTYQIVFTTNHAATAWVEVGGETYYELFAGSMKSADTVHKIVVPQQKLGGIPVSSTHIRDLIEMGLMEQAIRFLGHPHILTGTVIHGKALGRKLGVPTANLQLPEGLAIPRFGVYACSCLIDGKRYPAVTNLGTRPTVEGSGITVEPWILDFSGDLYGREIMLEFHYFLRPEQKFPSLEALKAEIHRNAEETRNYLKTMFIL